MTEAAMVEKSKSKTEPVAGQTKTPGTGDAPTPAPRRQLGVKEPIVFKWKLLGSAGDVVLTLFKSTERADVDAQFERIQREGYYQNLRIVEADAKVAQSKKTRESLEKERKRMGSAAEKKAREEKKPKTKQTLGEPKLIRIGRTKAAIARAAKKAAKSAKAKKASKTKKASKAVKKTKTAKKKTKKKRKTASKKKVKKTVKKKSKSRSATTKKKKSRSSSTRRRKR